MNDHTVDVLASTLSPALKTGPLPASRFRTVRNTINPSSAIQRRCQAPQPNSADTTVTLTQRLIRTETSYGKADQRVSRPATAVVSLSAAVALRRSAEEDCGTDGSDPGQRQQLQYSVLQRDLLGFTGHAAVDVDGVAQDRDRERNHGHHEPGRA